MHVAKTHKKHRYMYAKNGGSHEVRISAIFSSITLTFLLNMSLACKYIVHTYNTYIDFAPSGYGLNKTAYKFLIATQTS